MSELYVINGKNYRAYQTHWFCDGKEITQNEFSKALKKYFWRDHF
jgi:wobble nucleotide-excising tRNase